MRVVVTGASGFVGAHLVGHLSRTHDVQTVAAVRTPASFPPGVIQARVVDVTSPSGWAEAVAGADVVVHAAARAHILDEKAADPLAEFRQINVSGTLNVARIAARAGVRRFVFLSSIKVNGERTVPGRPYTADDAPAPVDPYGVSKAEAEQQLSKLAHGSGMELVVIRPVLVYGPGVKANFLALLRAVHRGYPLPLGAVHNRRSLVAIGNLTDLVVTCLRHPEAANRVFLASDGQDVSTSELIRRLARALRKPARLIPVPPRVLLMAGALTGRTEAVRRLCESLEADITKTRALLGWSPPESMDGALDETAAHFLRERAD